MLSSDWLLESFKPAWSLLPYMGALGRTVVARNRHARIIGLGDRRGPSAYTPCLVRIEGDPPLDELLAPFSFT